MTRYLIDINPSTPDGADALASGDDEIRQLKSDIKLSFPKIAGEVSASQSEINKLVGVTGRIFTDAGGTITGTVAFTGPISVNTDISLSGGLTIYGTVNLHGDMSMSNTLAVSNIQGQAAYFGGAVTLSATAVFLTTPKGITPTNAAHLTTKGYVDGAVLAGGDPSAVDIRAFKNSRLKLFYYGNL